MNFNDPNELAERYTAVWMEPDSDRRRKAIADIWSEDAIHFLQRTPRSQGHAAQRIVGNRHRQAGGVPQDKVEIAEKRLAQPVRVGALRRDAGETVDLAAVQGAGIVDGAEDALAEFLHTVGHDRDAALAGAPIAGGEIVQYLRQPDVIQRTLTVIKTRASLHQPQVREFTITPKGITLQAHDA